MRVSLALLLLLAVPARGDVSITVTTTPTANTQFSPRNVMAAWIEGPGGAFVKTIDRHSDVRTSDLVAWLAKAGPTDVDAITGATRQNHTAPLSFTWDLRDRIGALMPDGTYTIRMEVSDSNATQPAQNNEGTFTFVKSSSPQRQTGLANGGFRNVTVDFQPVTDRCNNGVVDPGELCDPGVAGSCPTSCATTDACMPSRLLGTAASCTARCAVTPITACADGDGCCPEGCDGQDADCAASGNTDLSGGCATGGGDRVWLVAAAWLAVLLGRRSRR